MSKINFQNLPSTSTPLNATNMNAIQWNMLIQHISTPDITIDSGAEISYDITFSTAFDTAPRIVLVTFNNDRFVYQIKNITKNGCKLWVRNVTSSAGVNLVGFTYIAIE